ncbi:PulJ/GspJ family protein [Magnetococcales bacterium HHB-1]
MTKIASKRDAGFTLLEVMIAGSLTLVLMMVIMTFYFNMLVTLESLMTSIRFNHEIRLNHQILTDGGYDAANTSWITSARFTPESNGIDHTSTGSTLTEGGTTTLTVSTGNLVTLTNAGSDSNTWQVWNNRLALTKNSTDPSADPSVQSGKVETSINCTASETPHRECTGTETLSVYGYIDNIVVNTTNRRVGNHMAEVRVNLIDPQTAGKTNLIADDYSDTFRMIISSY